MAQNDEVNINNSSEFTFDELQEAFNEIMDEFNKLRLKNKELKKANLFLMEKKEYFS